MTMLEPWRLSRSVRIITKGLAISPRPESIVFNNGVMEFKSSAQLPDIFWLHLAEVIPPVLFKKVETGYVAIESLDAHSKAQPLSSLAHGCLRGVWWSPQKARNEISGTAVSVRKKKGAKKT